MDRYKLDQSDPDPRPRPQQMADSAKMDVSQDRRLRGKVNFVSWKREFDREAKAYDVLDLLKGDEAIIDKPKKATYLDDDDGKDPTSIAATTQTLKNFQASTLRYNIDYNNWKSNKDSLRTANKLINAWVSDGIRIEIENCNNAKAAYDLIIQRYKVNDERARDDLLTELKKLKIDDCEDVTDYLNKLRRFKSDLAGVKYKMNDSMFATSILDGLEGGKWVGFKEKWDNIRAIQLDTKPDAPPSIDLLEDRLHHEALFKQRREEEKKNQEKAKKKASSGNGGNGGNSGNNSTPTTGSGGRKKEDKSHLKCGHCDSTGHVEDDCWQLHPEKIPRAIKEKMNAKPSGKNDSKSDKSDSKNNSEKMNALATGDVNNFKTKLAASRSLGTHTPPFPTSGSLTDSMAQTRDAYEIGRDAKWQRLGGDGVTRSYGIAGSEGALSAFVAGRFKSSDTWLADTAANMHVVNDTKWFTEFNSLDIDINTADNTAILEVKGGGKVGVLLRNSQGQATVLSLSDVAYAPKGRCNLLSIGMLAEKAGVCGQFDSDGMTLSTKEQGDIGYGRFSNGLYHMKIEQLPKPDDPFESGEVIAATVDFDDPVWRMHRRLGHLSLQNMLNPKKFSTGIDVTEKQIKAKLKTKCPVCATTRTLVRIPRDPATRQSNAAGDLIHVDIWGDYPIEGFDGTKYFLLMTDDFTRFTWSRRMANKSELPEAFRQLHKDIEKQHQITIRKYRCDNEFSNGPVGAWCKKHNIGMEPIEPFAHYMNGVAERNMRTVRERAAPMMQETSISGQLSKIIAEKSTEMLRISSIPANLWPEAFQHAVWHKNRSPARALKKKDKKTPWEALYGEPPSLERERIWGSRAYSAFPREKRMEGTFTKLHDPRGWIGYFVGCESESVYYIFNPEKHRVQRKGVSDIEDGEGLDDPQDAPSHRDIVPVPEIDLSVAEMPSEEEDESDTELEMDGDGISEPSQMTMYDEPVFDTGFEAFESGPENHQDDTESYFEPGQDFANDTDGEDDPSPEGQVVRSKYFGGMATKRTKKRQATRDWEDEDHPDSSEMSEMEKASDSEWIKPKISEANTSHRYMPDDTKCRHCFLRVTLCDRESIGTPCTRYSRYHRICEDQTARDKSLIHPNDRTKKANKRIRAEAKVYQDPPCRVCYKMGESCIRYGPEGTLCTNCRRNKRKSCDFDLRGAHPSKPAPVPGAKAPSKTKSGEPGVFRDQKCYNCATRNAACNGKYPCNNCQTKALKKKCMNVLEAERKKMLSKCVNCASQGPYCNKERPCSTCIELRRNCTYIEQGGLVTRLYKVEEAPKISNLVRPILGEDESSDDECVRCFTMKRNCDGGQPCSCCVKEVNADTSQNARCTWRKKGGLVERYNTEAYELAPEGGVKLKDNYEELLTKARARGKMRSEPSTYERERTLRQKKLKSTDVEDDLSTDPSDADDEAEEDRDYENGRHRFASDILQQATDRLRRERELNKDPKVALMASNDKRLPDPKTFAEAMASDEADLWLQGIEEEKSNLEEKHTYDIVPIPKGVKPITSRLVFKRKYGPEGEVTRHKTRLVARGFQQEEGVDYDETFAAVVKPASYRILFALAAICGWLIHQGDVKTAFLNSGLPKPIYMKAPKGMELPLGWCFLVLRAIYGLKQSPRAWYQKFKQEMEAWGWRISAYDPCVFIQDDSGLILQLHVDDMITFGSNLQAILDFKKRLTSTFLTTDEGECSWYLGMHVEQKPGEVTLHQRQYVDQILAKYGFDDITPVRTPQDSKLAKQADYAADSRFRLEYQSKVGSLNFAANQTRPDISFSTGYVARYASNPNQSHMDAVNRIFAYLNSDRSKGISYSGKHGFNLQGFVDSDFAGCEDSRKSTTGWVFTLAGGPISWSSQRQKTVATSTLDAEYIASAEAAKEAVWIRGFINDLRIPGIYVKSVPLSIDSNSALKLTRNPEFHAKSKHIDVKHHFIREKVEDGVINTQRVDTRDNLADMFTKALARPTHEDLTGRLGMASASSIEGPFAALALADRDKRREDKAIGLDKVPMIGQETKSRHEKIKKDEEKRRVKEGKEQFRKDQHTKMQEAAAQLKGARGAWHDAGTAAVQLFKPDGVQEEEVSRFFPTANTVTQLEAPSQPEGATRSAGSAQQDRDDFDFELASDDESLELNEEDEKTITEAMESSTQGESTRDS